MTDGVEEMLGEIFRVFDGWGSGVLMRSVWWMGGGWSREIWVPEDWSGSVRGRVACGRQVPMAERSEPPSENPQRCAPRFVFLWLR
jgi:hypothetical protein